MTTGEHTSEATPVPPAPSPGLPRWQDVTMGAVSEAGVALAGLVASVRTSAADSRERSTQRLTSVAQLARQRVVELAERGAVEREQGRRRVAGALEALIRAAATAPVVNLVVDAQLDRVLRPRVAAILDDVLVRLESDPERLQPLIRGQREGMVNELVDKVRAGAAAGDAAVDRVTGRRFGRAGQPQPVPGPDADVP